jgi:UV DNA damage endonuclease
MELKNRIGYACINMELAKEGVTTNRDIRLATMQKENSMDILSAKALANVQGLKRIVEWNTEKGIKFYRMSSNIFPWWSKYKFTDLKDWDQIKECLEYVGKFARDNDQRLSFHPSHFVVLGSKNPKTQLTCIRYRIYMMAYIKILGFLLRSILSTTRLVHKVV